MQPLYPRLTTLIDALDRIPEARRGEPYPEGDGAGGHLAEEIQRAQARRSATISGPSVAEDPAVEPGEGPSEAGEPGLTPQRRRTPCADQAINLSTM